MKVRKEIPVICVLTILRKRKVTYKELAEECDCSVRTVIRAIDVITPYVPIITIRGCRGGVELIKEIDYV